MTCKEAEKKIPYFLQDELEGRKLAEFVEHIENCPECEEELTIQFLVTEGMGKLEEGDDFNLQKALLMKMEGARQKIKINRTIREEEYTFEITAAFCNKCGGEMGIPALMDYNIKEIDEQYRKASDNIGG